MKIVLDSNVLLVAIGRKSHLRPIWEAFIQNSYQLILTDDIVFEYTEVLQRQAASGAAELVLNIFIESPNIFYQRVYYGWNLLSDPDDNKFFDAAIAANADYLVTNDSHFNSAKTSPFPSVRIITAEEFLVLLTKI